MLNISNDGWFGHSDQQPQHLVNCAFRAIENRVGIARAVNTGVSGFIRPDGSWYSLVADSNSFPLAGGNGLQTARVAISPQVTFYSRFGDVFGAVCAMVGLCAIMDALICGLRRRSRKEVAA
jgi:apolipoprotein N-acyltransferase